MSVVGLPQDEQTVRIGFSFLDLEYSKKFFGGPLDVYMRLRRKVWRGKKHDLLQKYINRGILACVISVEKLAAECGIAWGTTRKYLKVLEEEGWIIILETIKNRGIWIIQLGKVIDGHETYLLERRVREEYEKELAACPEDEVVVDPINGEERIQRSESALSKTERGISNNENTVSQNETRTLKTEAIIENTNRERIENSNIAGPQPGAGGDPQESTLGKEPRDPGVNPPKNGGVCFAPVDKSEENGEKAASACIERFRRPTFHDGRQIDALFQYYRKLMAEKYGPEIVDGMVRTTGRERGELWWILQQGTPETARRYIEIVVWDWEAIVEKNRRMRMGNYPNVKDVAFMRREIAMLAAKGEPYISAESRGMYSVQYRKDPQGFLKFWRRLNSFERKLTKK